jgi:hypothetical protein
MEMERVEVHRLPSNAFPVLELKHALRQVVVDSYIARVHHLPMYVIVVIRFHRVILVLLEWYLEIHVL